MTGLTEGEKISVDSARVGFANTLADALTNCASSISAQLGASDFAFESFSVLNPGDVPPEVEESMIRFLLIRLRLSVAFQLHEDIDRTLLALSRWGAESSEVFDALEGIVGFWVCRPLSANLFWPAGTRNVPVMAVKSRTGRRRG